MRTCCDARLPQGLRISSGSMERPEYLCFTSARFPTRSGSTLVDIAGHVRVLLPHLCLGLHRRHTPPMFTSGYIHPGTHGHHTGPMARPHIRGSTSCLPREFIFEFVLQFILEFVLQLIFEPSRSTGHTTSGTSDRLLHLTTRRPISNQRGPLNHELALVESHRVEFW